MDWGGGGASLLWPRVYEKGRLNRREKKQKQEKTKTHTHGTGITQNHVSSTCSTLDRSFGKETQMTTTTKIRRGCCSLTDNAIRKMLFATRHSKRFENTLKVARVHAK